MLRERKNISDAAKNKILQTNPARFYGLAL